MTHTFDLLSEKIIQIEDFVNKHKASTELHFENQIIQLQKDLNSKAEKKNTLQNLDILNEALANLSKEMIMKANIQEMLAFIEKKSSKEEVMIEIS
jgi:ribosomal 50S subunit-associated protein YjgA (DUF615 family)